MDANKLFIEAMNSNKSVRATVMVDQETRIRIGSVEKIGNGYVTLRLEDGSFRSTRNENVMSVEII
jgi:hypothetical protein